jgi:hypothetical protein
MADDVLLVWVVGRVLGVAKIADDALARAASEESLAGVIEA